ncbi:hypothetical protein KUH32_07510 [Thalassococcus sp. CAU 1522]|uniref:Uncharacterized protein n=1 Tax=Thalassococcus arenae TaxID=2851652 RepID=A0ABS6N6H0_9RHOB|nr:hypothetical protein [Thalassococcus arenae]MBV2359616.1 hypothetical protein [Thalassococcus arenae]
MEKLLQFHATGDRKHRTRNFVRLQETINLLTRRHCFLCFAIAAAFAGHKAQHAPGPDASKTQLSAYPANGEKYSFGITIHAVNEQV